jgi:hypothetical protein
MSEAKLDYIEVSRAAHELGERHGREAHLYAARYAQEASSQGSAEEHAFWHAVAQSLMPRSTS